MEPIEIATIILTGNMDANDTTMYRIQQNWESFCDVLTPFNCVSVDFVMETITVATVDMTKHARLTQADAYYRGHRLQRTRKKFQNTQTHSTNAAPQTRM